MCLLNSRADANKRLIQTKAEFKKQMIQFKTLTTPAAKPFDLPKVVYTGKTKKGMNDDVCDTPGPSCDPPPTDPAEYINAQCCQCL